MKKIYTVESKEILKLVFFSLILIFSLTACNKDECCENNCIESCQLFEDFEDETIGTSGNWLGIATRTLIFQNRNGSQVLYVEDGSGGTVAYNDVDFPKDLMSQGCALKLDIEYLAGSDNSLTTDNGIGIYDGTTPLSASFTAFFILNSSNLITSGNPPTTIEVPLALATSAALPSNSFGTWVINPSTTPAADATNFNNLIQNISGVYFSIDEGSNPAERWWFDNFCFKQCCP